MAGFNGCTDAGNVKKTDIVDNLTSSATDKPGSANMLRVLNETIAKTQFGRMTNSEAISANTIYEMSVTYPNAYTSIAYPVVSLVCWTDPSTISWVIKSQGVSGFTIRIKSTNNITAGDLLVNWFARGT